MKLHTYRDVLMRICPQFAARVETFAERILSSLEALDPRQVVPTHETSSRKTSTSCAIG